MVKINLTRIAAFVMAFFMVGFSANAQTNVWGVGSTNGVAAAEFSANFVQATSFTPGITNPNDWTALSVFDANGSGANSAAYWTQNLTGYSQGAYWSGTTPVPSASQVNGVAIFDSDFLDNGGTQGAFGQGTSPSSNSTAGVTGHRGELISPRINLTGYEDSTLIIEFFTYYRDFDAEMLVGFSIDDGLTWTEVDFKAEVGNLDAERARVLFKDAVGANNLTQCRIRFAFEGRYYFTIIDDVSIQTAPQYDIAIGRDFVDGTTILDAADNMKVGNHRYVALENLDPTDLREWWFGARVINLGGEDILPTASPMLYVGIDYTNALTGTVEPLVYLDSLPLDTLVSGDLQGEIQVDLMDNIDFIMSRTDGGDYRVSYWVSQTNTDGRTDNDTTGHTFTVTTQTNGAGYISNAPNNAAGTGVGSSRAIFPLTTATAGGPLESFEYGSVYYFPKGATDTVVLDSMSFRYYLPNGFSGDADQILFSKIYEVDASVDGTVDDFADLTEVGLATIPLNGLGTPTGTARGDYANVTVTGYIEAGSGDPFGAFKDTSFYFITVLINPAATLGVAQFEGDDVPWFSAEDRINYYLNAALTTADTIMNPSPVSIKRAGATSADLNWQGFGMDIVPSIGLYVTNRSLLPVSVTTVNTTEGAELNVYPNPASDVLNVEFSLEEASDVTYIVTDVTGRVVNLVQSNNVTNDLRTLDISRLSAGVYMITAKTEKGTSTQRFTVK
jgi:hypothetical protein